MDAAHLDSKNKSDFLCEPCKKFFTMLKDIIGDVNNMTKDTLTNALNVRLEMLIYNIDFS